MASKSVASRPAANMTCAGAAEALDGERRARESIASRIAAVRRLGTRSPLMTLDCHARSTWSPGNPTSRLMKSTDGFEGSRNTMTSPRRGSPMGRIWCSDRQAQSVGKFIHKNEVSVDQSRHHRRRRNSKRFDHEGTNQQHDQDDREEGARLGDRATAAPTGGPPELCRRRLPNGGVQPANSGGGDQRHHQRTVRSRCSSEVCISSHLVPRNRHP